MKGNKNPVVDMSSMNDNVLRPWARNPETDIKLDRAINGLNNILQMTAPQKFSGKQGYSSLDRTPDRIIALYEFARSHPDWVDAFLDGLPMDEPQRRPENVLRAMENILYEDEYSEDESSVEGYGEEEDDLPVGDSLLADLEVLEAAFGLTGAADTIRPDLGGMGVSKKYLPNGKPRFERDALHRHSCYEKYMLLNKKQKRTEERKLAGAQFLGRYRLSNTALSLLPTQTQRRRRKRDKSRGLSSEVNVMTINEPDREEGQRPMTAQEFYDTSLDLLSEGNGDGSDEILRPGTAQRPPTGFLRAGTGLMRTATPGAIPPSPLNRTLGTPRSAANRPSTAELPLLRPYTAEKSLNQSQSLGFSAPSSNPQPSLASSASLGRVAPPKSNFRPSTTGCGRPVSTPSASRYEVGGGLGGLSVVARPQSNVPLSKGKGKQTMYQDTEAKFLDSGKVEKFAPFMHREMSKLRSVRDQMRTMEGRMLAFSGNLNAVMDDPNDEYAAMKNTGISPGGVQFAKKTMVPIDAQRKMTERIYKEVKAKAELDQVDPRLKCDGYDRVIPPERLYLSETKKFIVNNGSYDLMRSTMDRTFHIKQGELQEYAEEAQRLGKRPFEVGPGGMKC